MHKRDISLDVYSNCNLYMKISYFADRAKCIAQLGLNTYISISVYSHSAPDVSRPSHFDFNQRVFWGLLHVAISHADL